MRHAAIGIFLFVLIGIVIYTASMTGTSGMVGGGSDSVPHCQVLYYSIAVSDIISSVNANVECDIMDSYTVTASVTSGASTGSGQTATSLTAGTPAVVAVTISPSVTIGSSTYDVDVLVKK